MKSLMNQRGQLLIEAVIAMTLVGIIMTGIVTALVYSINNSNISKAQNLATSYAQEGLDIARDTRDSDFASFSALSGYYTLPSGTTTIPSGLPSALIDGKFMRQVYINQTGVDGRTSTQVCTDGTAIFIASIVTWADNRCTSGARCHKAELNSCFSDPAKILY